MPEFIKVRRLRRAWNKLEDARHEYDTWVEPFHRRLGTVSPRTLRRWDRKLRRLRERVARRGGCIECGHQLRSNADCYECEEARRA